MRGSWGTAPNRRLRAAALNHPASFETPEQVSKNRFHNELKLNSPDEVDEELIGWLKDAYTLG